MLINRKIKRELLNGESILVANEKGLSYAMSFSFPKWKGYSLFSFIHQRRLSEVNSAKEKKMTDTPNGKLDDTEARKSEEGCPVRLYTRVRERIGRH